jgi:hypothetical protein
MAEIEEDEIDLDELLKTSEELIKETAVRRNFRKIEMEIIFLLRQQFLGDDSEEEEKYQKLIDLDRIMVQQNLQLIEKIEGKLIRLNLRERKRTML